MPHIDKHAPMKKFRSSMAMHRKHSMFDQSVLETEQTDTKSNKNLKITKKKRDHVEELIQDFKKDLWNKKPYVKAEFHQCIPNPERLGELITVQLVTQ